MHSIPKESFCASSKRTMLVLMSLSALYQYMYCMAVSGAYALSPIFGGALFMSARIAMELARQIEEGKKLPRKMRATGFILLSLMLLCNVFLLAVYPALRNTNALWMLFAVVLLLTLRVVFSRRLMKRIMRKTIGRPMFLLLFISLQLLPMGIAGTLFFSTLPAASAWGMLDGFALSSVLECYGLWREREGFLAPEQSASPKPETIDHTASGLREVGAYHSFERFHWLILMALQITLVMVYTFVGLTTEELITCLVLSVALTLVMRELTDLLLKKLKSRSPAATSLLIAGLILWMYSLLLFYTQLGRVPNSLMSYFSLGLSVSGLTICITCLSELETQMTGVARFGLENQLEGYYEIRAAMTEMATLIGQMIALGILILLCIPAGFSLGTVNISQMIQNFRPLMILPPLLLLCAALISVLRFPMNNRYFQKLGRFLTLLEEGGVNPALEKQLDEVVVCKHKNRFGIKIIISLLRPLYYHRVLGKENTAAYEDGSMILVCNHGELYGPIVANLYVPISFRPWVISNMMSREALVTHIYEGTLRRQKWLPEKWKLPLVRAVSPLLIWIFESIEAIPVYRGNPRELMKTFRLTIEAMQAGDNILLFPENGETDEKGERGYVDEGVGALYTGFAMLAPAYHKKTGKSAVFVPIYASKRLRTLSLGEGIVYNPDAPPMEEKLRIVERLQQSMQTMYQQELDNLAEDGQKKKKKRKRAAGREDAQTEVVSNEAQGE